MSRHQPAVAMLAVLALVLPVAPASAAPSELQKAAQRTMREADLVAGKAPSAYLTRKTGPAVAVTATEAAVGDVDSFGRNLRWLGVRQANVVLTSDCTGLGSDGNACQVLNPAGEVTSFNFDDISRITLPKNASNSLLCYWWSPVLRIHYANPTAVPVVGSLSYLPTLTVENPVLDDPALIDATTGAPFNGRLLAGMTSSERLEVPLPAATALTERSRDSAVCIAGFVSRRALVDTYGLSEAQATEFFRHETTVRINITGSSRYIDDASLIFGLRIIGD